MSVSWASLHRQSHRGRGQSSSSCVCMPSPARPNRRPLSRADRRSSSSACACCPSCSAASPTSFFSAVQLEAEGRLRRTADHPRSRATFFAGATLGSSIARLSSTPHCSSIDASEAELVKLVKSLVLACRSSRSRSRAVLYAATLARERPASALVAIHHHMYMHMTCHVCYEARGVVLGCLGCF